MAYKPRILGPTEGGTGASNTATSRKMLVGDGTNFVASTETWAVPGTSGNVLTSDGTNWTSAAPAGGGFVTITKQLTSSQIKNLHATPIEAVAAQGAGTVILLIDVSAKFIYGGSNVFVAGASQTINLYFGTTIANWILFANSRIVSAASIFGFPSSAGNAMAGTPIASIENVALNFYNPVVTEISGNAANDNSMSFSIVYYVASL